MRKLLLLGGLLTAFAAAYLLSLANPETGRSGLQSSESVGQSAVESDLPAVAVETITTEGATSVSDDDDILSAVVRRPFVAPEEYRNRKQLPELPDGPLAAFINEQMERARQGDAEAGYLVWDGLARCADVPATQASLNDELDRLQQTHLVNGVYQENIDRQLSRLTARYEICEGIAVEDRQAAFEWLDQSAELGFSQSRVAYFVVFDRDTITQDEYTTRLETAIAYLRREAYDRGNYDALVHLALSLQDGKHLDQDLSAAYAHYYAAQTLLPTPLVDYQLASLEDSLTQGELRSAIEQGQEILDRCCRQSEGEDS